MGAVFIASLGLNTNSTAVVIGAMLISPLMGPIMGLGLGLGTNDFTLVNKSIRNFLIMFVLSVTASSLFFLISPVKEAGSELLGRTSPTVYDVLIAFFGGMAGIIAGASKLRNGNVIPGVAKVVFGRRVLAVKRFYKGFGERQSPDAFGPRDEIGMAHIARFALSFEIIHRAVVAKNLPSHKGILAHL